MPKTVGDKPKGDKKGAKVSWRDADDATAVAILRQCKDNGMQADSGWKPVVWTQVSVGLKDSPGPEKTPEKCRDHWGTLKANFLEVRELLKLSGFGWDDGLKMVTAVDDVWDRLLKVPGNKKYAKWRKKCFPIYDDVLFLVDGIVATGVGAFHAGAPVGNNGASAASASAAAEDDPSTDKEDEGNSAPSATPKTPAPRRFQDDLTPSSPAKGSSSPPKSARRRRARNADAATDMASALREVAGSMRVRGSPEIRADAVQLMEDDGELSDGECVNAMRLFTKEIEVAQTFLASKNKTRRTAFLQTAIADAGFF
ncbi:Myb-like domain-containing protein [Mycena kentingensis (nom. inval.)]|nr:Myb-like domain-containing protein [Mycena kentingensis (nom. inval.)]